VVRLDDSTVVLHGRGRPPPGPTPFKLFAGEGDYCLAHARTRARLVAFTIGGTIE
jgi:hypothetical protein